MDSIVEIMITTKEEIIFEKVKNVNLQFDSTEFVLDKHLFLGYDAETFTNDLGYEISFMNTSFLFMISISESATFEWRKEMFEGGGENGEFKYIETEDVKFYYRNFALLKVDDEKTLEQIMINKFGTLKIDETISIESNMEQIRSKPIYQKYKSYIDESIISNKKYKEEFFKNGIGLQVASTLDKNRYMDFSETENDIFRIYTKNEWLYTLIMLEYLFGQILK